jgi:hypothetical protein
VSYSHIIVIQDKGADIEQNKGQKSDSEVELSCMTRHGWLFRVAQTCKFGNYAGFFDIGPRYQMQIISILWIPTQTFKPEISNAISLYPELMGQHTGKGLVSASLHWAGICGFDSSRIYTQLA